MGQISCAEGIASVGLTQARTALKNKDSILNKEKMAKRCGSIPVTGRFVTTRKLEEDYKLEPKVLGSGMNGPVHLATGRADGRKYAVKSFKKKKLSSKRLQELRGEVEAYISLDHPHVARLEMVFETDDEAHLVMELMAGGELYERLSSKKQYTEEMAADATRQMLLAVAYLHSKSLAHRDLKLENFLYATKEGDLLKLIDFGFAKFCNQDELMSQSCGSVHYVAPEVLAKSYTHQADVWSMGVIVYLLLTGMPPMSGCDDEVIRKIKRGDVNWSHPRVQKLSTPAREFCQALLVVDPKERLTAEAALAHPWLQVAATSQESIANIRADCWASMGKFAQASHFKRSILSMMAWSLSSEDRELLDKEFLTLDKDRRGSITHEQMLEVLQKNLHIETEDAEIVFKSLDANDDKEIAYSEFMAAALQDRVNVDEDVLRKTFLRFDQDNNGQITKANLCNVLGADVGIDDVDQIFKEVDTSKDGLISYTEFLAEWARPGPVCC